MHPEPFELKALVAGRLDAHRRREIDDHLGSCADCSRHYVAMMLGSSSPKTAEAEARQALVPTGAGTVLTLGGNSSAVVEVYGIDAPLAPSAPRPPKLANGHSPALETEFPPSSSRTQVPVSASLVDVIAKLRAESEAQKSAAATPAAVAQLEPEIVAPIAESPLIEPSIFTPTPADGVSIIRPRPTPGASASTAERPLFMTRPASASPASNAAAQQELVVTFSSTPQRSTSYRSPSSVSVVTPSADRDYVSQAVPNLATQNRPEFQITETTVARKPQSMLTGVIVGGALIALAVAFSGYRYFKSSVSQAAAAAAVAAAKQVQAAAANSRPAPAPVTAAPAQAPVQTRIVYVREPARRESKPAETATASSAVVPLALTLPDINVSTGSAESATQANAQRSATSELTRSARATATRTAAPRPY